VEEIGAQWCAGYSIIGTRQTCFCGTSQRRPRYTGQAGKLVRSGKLRKNMKRQGSRSSLLRENDTVRVRLATGRPKALVCLVFEPCSHAASSESTDPTW